MTTYSVWDHKRKAYDYYESALGATGTHAGTPPTPLFTSQLGMSPEEGAWRVPAGARKVGSGTVARGRVATLGGVEDFGVPPMVIPIALGLAAWYFWRKR